MTPALPDEDINRYLLLIEVYDTLRYISIGEIAILICALLAKLHTYPECVSISPLTVFPHWGITSLGNWIIPVWFLCGALFAWGLDNPGATV